MIIIHGEERVHTGKSASRRLRKVNNKIPSIIYGLNKSTLHISLDHNVMFQLQQNNNLNNCILTIKIANQEYLVSVHDVQRHCFKKKILHIDFLCK
ncbi:50S ribosomal protein L25 [Buchnera aphidicola (Takecallis arundicolens)]|uniref:50S ribosomal protein L25 n=1 Tax=Buchnera aphidicola TaxID=9 RepID=UPI003463BAAA